MNNVKIVSVITVIDRERNPDAETVENGGERKKFQNLCGKSPEQDKCWSRGGVGWGEDNIETGKKTNHVSRDKDCRVEDSHPHAMRTKKPSQTAKNKFSSIKVSRDME